MKSLLRGTGEGKNIYVNISMSFQTVINPTKQGIEASGLVRKTKGDVTHSDIIERKLPTDYEVPDTILGIGHAQ